MNVIIGYKKNNELYDLLSLPENYDEPVYYDTEDGLHIIRHTMAHILAQAISRVYGNVDFGIGPVTDTGFYYDFNIGRSVSSKELDIIETAMHQIINEDLHITKHLYTKDDINILFKDSKLKQEIINNLDSKVYTTYSQGEFVDLCRGPHLSSTGLATKYFKLVGVSEVTWHTHKLQRIVGIAFNNKEEYDNYFMTLQTSIECSATRIAVDMDIFFKDENAPGCIFWTQKGVIYKEILKSKIREIYSNYTEVETPTIYHDKLWHLTGHINKYKDNMFICQHGDINTIIKPMNCPAHCLYFKHLNVTKNQLPIRISEFGIVCRREPAGSLNSSKRLQNFCQDDGHIFCTLEHIYNETILFIKNTKRLYNSFGLNNIKYIISTRPEISIGNDIDWEQAETYLKNALQTLDVDLKIAEGDGAFYGPKIELQLQDNYNHWWTCGTIQIDFYLTSNVDASYIDNNTQKKLYPIVLHRAAIGSIERFTAMLLELTNGKIPLWLHPIQVVILPISDKFVNYAQEVCENISRNNIRVDILTQHTLSKRLKISIQHRIPFIIIIGQKEVEQKILSIKYYNQDLHLDINNFIKYFYEINNSWN